MRKILLSLALAFTLLASGCKTKTTGDTEGLAIPEAQFPVTIAASSGNVVIEKRPERIVSLSSTATEILFAIEAGDQVEAVDDQSNFPADAPKSDLSGFQPNVEAIAARRPDLVVYQSDPGDLGASLEKLNIPALIQPAAKKLDDTYKQIEDLGRATGNLQTASRLVSSMKRKITDISNSVPDFIDPPTYYHELDATYFTATSKTFIGEIYSLVGLKNIADEADKDGTGYPQLSAELIVDANPDFIFLADTKCCAQNKESVSQRAGWSEITAVRNGAVVELDDDIASRWGPRVVDLLEKIIEAVSEKEPART
jgi:iron complex transport system substrate-binding protein